ncbi:hypothetical protein [Saccharopolyspora spinosa]|uniref:Uncharacterized protein n=1 Tax=Saccharopolyspora spinosa TaxID=60894 RepID=A0A2N3Y8K0_SACSN|nr:hypothetical protein [Saccharopolyspora spinosa]PKW19215.1 hypothetical protein A8926_7377 [Saccharopolyspora spinosa]
MRAYAVHLLFHLLAIAAGAGCGVAGWLWWFGGDPNSLWLAIGALVVGIIVLVLEALYIRAEQPPAPPRSQPRPQQPPPRSQPRPQQPSSRSRPKPQQPQRPRERTRPDLKPVAAPSSDTLLQPSPNASKAIDQETKTSALDALGELGRRTNPPGRQN